MSSAARLLQRQLVSVLQASRGALWPACQAAQACHACLQLTGPQQQLPAAPQQQQLLLLAIAQHGGGFAAHYAKGKGKKHGKGRADDDDDDDAAAAAAAAAAAEEPEFALQPIEQLMEAAVEHLQHELSGVRTGRANPGLLENLLVDADGDKVPIKGCGTVTVRNPQLLAVVLYDAALAKPVEKAIRESPLSLNPQTEGSEVLVKLPRMTKDTIEKMVKLVNLEAEGAHQSIRRARQKGMDAIKKAFKAASADEKKRAEKEVQKLHDQYVAEVERLKKIKDTELRTHND